MEKERIINMKKSTQTKTNMNYDGENIIKEMIKKIF